MHCWDAEREKQGSSADEVNGRGQMKDGLLAQFQPLPLRLQMAAGDSWATGACVRLQRLMRDPDRPPSVCHARPEGLAKDSARIERF
jgi:hypothetical protein